MECEIHGIRREMKTFRRNSPQSVSNAGPSVFSGGYGHVLKVPNRPCTMVHAMPLQWKISCLA